MTQIEIDKKEFRGVNLRIIIAWATGVITVVIMGTLWYSGINTAVAETREATSELKALIKDKDSQSQLERKEIMQKLDAQQLQLDQLEWQWENFKEFYDLNPKSKTTKR